MVDPSNGDESALNRRGSDTLSRAEREGKTDRQQRNDRSAWNWLLLPAIVIPLLVPLYNRVEPTLFGWPFFYWGQLAFIALGVATTSVVFQKTKTRKGPDAGRASSRAETVERKGN